MFVNLPVKDLNRSVDFFTKLGFKFNPQFTDEKATCMIIGQDSFVMLLVEPFFQTFTKKPLCDASKNTETIIALSAGSKAQVDELAGTALKSGGTTSIEPQDAGWMYSRSFQDPDGHQWEVFFMDAAAFSKG